MRLDAAKWDARDAVNAVAGAGVAVLTFTAVATGLSLGIAVSLAVLAGLGFLAARLLGRRPVDTPAPRPLPRRWSKGLFRRAAYDQPFNTHLGWTSGSEPGGSLPDARRVVPQGSYGVGDLTDAAAGLLIITAVFISAFRYGNSLGAFLVFGTLGLLGFTLIRFVRWLRHR